MTPFETQVAEALAATWDHALVRDCWRKGENYEAFGYLLACNIAPRVAAAIEAATDQFDKEALLWRRVALSALRGETP